MDSKVSIEEAKDGRAGWLLPALFIFIATIMAQLVSLAFGRVDETHSFVTIVLPSLLFLSILTLPACLVGSVLGPRVSLGAPRISALFSRKRLDLKTLIEGVMPAIMLSVGVGFILILLRIVARPFLPEELPAFGHRGVIGGLAVSIGAAVAEEVWFRFGLMTLLVWIASRLMGHTKARPAVIWCVIIISALVFGSVHLPQLISYGAGSSIAVMATILGNLLVGVLYGWCYWKQGLVVAIISHFTVDVVLHVLPALF